MYICIYFFRILSTLCIICSLYIHFSKLIVLCDPLQLVLNLYTVTFHQVPVAMKPNGTHNLATSNIICLLKYYYSTLLGTYLLLFQSISLYLCIVTQLKLGCPDRLRTTYPGHDNGYVLPTQSGYLPVAMPPYPMGIVTI